MEKEPAFAQREDDLSVAHFVDGTARDLALIARTKSGQHALAAHTKPETAAGAQACCRDCHLLRVPVHGGIFWRKLQSHETFREELHSQDVPAILPQERAAVSKTRS